MNPTTKIIPKKERCRTLKIRHFKWKEIDGICPYCNEKMWIRGIHKHGKAHKEATTEHIIPKSRGGKNHQSNLTVSCKQCNHNRGSIPHEQFMRIRKISHWDRLAKKAKNAPYPKHHYATPAMFIEHYHWLTRRYLKSVWRKFKGTKIAPINHTIENLFSVADHK